MSLIFQPVNFRKAQQYIDNASTQDAKEAIDRSRPPPAPLPDRERARLARHEDQLVEGVANYRIATWCGDHDDKSDWPGQRPHGSALNKCSLEAASGTWKPTGLRDGRPPSPGASHAAAAHPHRRRRGSGPRRLGSGGG